MGILASRNIAHRPGSRSSPNSSTAADHTSTDGRPDDGHAISGQSSSTTQIEKSLALSRHPGERPGINKGYTMPDMEIGVSKMAVKGQLDTRSRIEEPLASFENKEHQGSIDKDL